MAEAWGVTRDETVELFLGCEARRAGALASALAEGKSEYDAREIAHEAAKAHWNAWAEDMLAKRKALEQSGQWEAEKSSWMEASEVNFSRCLFLLKGGDGTLKAPGEDKEDLQAGALPVKSMVIDGTLDMSGVVFPGDASFDSAAFQGRASFASAAFSGGAQFASAAFSGRAWFDSAAFSGDASFDSAAFSGRAFFRGQTFTKDVFFSKARFGPGRADFGLATFERVVQFDGAAFMGEADFNAVSGKRTFSMSGAKFEGVPNFIQAHFEEAPRLDNVVVTPTKNPELLSADKALDLFARWRELRRLAIQAHDTDRELEFNAQEIRAEQAASGWPIPNKAHGWKIWLRLYFGWLYGVFSDYGRSLFRPLAAWAIGILAFAAFYLSQTDAMQTGRYAMWQSVPCYPPPTYSEIWRNNWKMWEKPKSGAASLNETVAANSNETVVGGLSEKLRSQTNARAEALHLAFRNAFVVLDGGSDASHRMYGCLYGLELYAGQNPVPIVPSAVSTASAIQKLISGVLIFLFGLALRNVLKVK
jgi:hypothetical protein